MRISDGAFHVAGFRGPRYDVLHFADYVRRVQGKAICGAPTAEAHGAGGMARQENRPRLLRLFRSGESQAHAAIRTEDGLRESAVRKEEWNCDDYVQPPEGVECVEPADSRGVASRSAGSARRR